MHVFDEGSEPDDGKVGVVPEASPTSLGSSRVE